MSKDSAAFISTFRGLSGKGIGEVIQSDYHIFNNAKWAVKLFPAGETVHSSNYVSLLLIRRGFCHEKVTVSFTIVSRDNQKNNIVIGPDANLYDADDVLGWGWPEASLQSIFYDDTLGYVMDDEVTIETTITFQTGQRSLQWDIKKLLFNTQSTDILVRVEEETFPVHKFILTSRSPVFRAMLSNSMLESSTHEVIMTDFPSHIVRELLVFLYTDECDINLIDTIVDDLIKIANKYEVACLQLLCEKYLAGKITTDNCFEKLVFAHTYHYPHLKAEALKFIVASGNSVVSVCSDEMMAELGIQLVTDLVRAFAAKPPATPTAY